MTPESLVRTVEDFLAGSSNAVVMEDGAVTFDLEEPKYSISGERNKCLLHLWSTERNVVRRGLEANVKNEVLRLAVQRLGQSKPTKLEICREHDRRTPTVKRAAGQAYRRVLECLLQRRFPGFSVGHLSTAMDLERSFGPIYARGLMQRGQSAFAMIGVNDAETQASIDAMLTFGILWQDTCRQSQADKLLVEGLKLFLPAGTTTLTRERIAYFNPHAAKWQLYELSEREDNLKEIDFNDRGNVATRLVHSPNEAATYDRFRESIQRIQEQVSEAEIAVSSPALHVHPLRTPCCVIFHLTLSGQWLASTSAGVTE